MSRPYRPHTASPAPGQMGAENDATSSLTPTSRPYLPPLHVASVSSLKADARCLSMNGNEPNGEDCGPRIVVHSFETAGGAARRVKNQKSPTPPGLATRRTHTKSRGGCSHCRIRRVKCDEKKPVCSRCSQGKHPCSYPDVLAKSSKRPPRPLDRTTSSHSSIALFPTMTSDTFTLLDMRFFHHFLIKARPHLPVGNTVAWAREIPQLAHRNLFLMYAFLALGSSHLGRLVENRYFLVHALTYRIKGLDGLRRAMAQKTWDSGHADSVIAAGHALMLQSTHIEDGLHDWMSLLRMVFSISRGVSENENISTELNLRPMLHYEYIAPYLHLLPSIDARLLSAGLRALENLRPELNDSNARSFLDILEQVFQTQQKSPQQGYLKFGEAFKFWLDLSDEEFAKHSGPLEDEMQLLLAYFISMLLMMLAQGVVESHEGLEWHTPRHVDGLLGWVCNCLRNVPIRLKDHCQFIEMILASATAESNGMPFPGPRVLRFDAAYDFHMKIKTLKLHEVHISRSIS